MGKSGGLLKWYHQFVLSNAELIGNLESTLRSLCYIIPGRFNDSDFVAELLFALLNLFRLYNDNIISKSGGGCAGPLRPSIWNRYLEYLKEQSPLARVLVTLLNTLRIVEVPLEMIVGKMMGLCSKHRLILIVELQKMVMKVMLWMLSGFRKTTGTLMPSSIRAIKPKETMQEGLSLSQADFMAKSLDSEHPDHLHAFIKAGRMDPLLMMPELVMSECSSSLEKLRELAHIARPVVYASMYILGRSPSAKWAAWSAALGLELFASWPEIQQLLSKVPPIDGHSRIEKDEDRSRTLRLLWFLLRDPFYTEFTKSRIDSLKESLGEWKLLKPLLQTTDTYQKLCETIHFYTSSS